MTHEELTEKVLNLEKITAHLKRRLFRAERRLLVTGALLTHADDNMDDDKDHPFPAKLVEGLSDCSLKLKKLGKEENECCAHLPGSG